LTAEPGRGTRSATRACMLWLLALLLAVLSVDLFNILLVQVCLIVLRALEAGEQPPKLRPAASSGLPAVRLALRLSA
jgi:hypothetical protein